MVGKALSAQFYIWRLPSCKGSSQPHHPIFHLPSFKPNLPGDSLGPLILLQAQQSYKACKTSPPISLWIHQASVSLQHGIPPRGQWCCLCLWATPQELLGRVEQIKQQAEAVSKFAHEIACKHMLPSSFFLEHTLVNLTT